MRSAPGRLTGEMCVRMTFRERPRGVPSASATATSPRPCSTPRPTRSATASRSARPSTCSTRSPWSRSSRVRRRASQASRRTSRSGAASSTRSCARCAPRRIRAGRRVRLRVTLQRIRGRRFTRTYTVRDSRAPAAGPAHARPPWYAAVVVRRGAVRGAARRRARRAGGDRRPGAARRPAEVDRAHRPLGRRAHPQRWRERRARSATRGSSSAAACGRPSTSCGAS